MSTLKLNDFATESGGWYKLSGEPCYNVIAKNGSPRATTLADARKMNLVPSVTKIIKEAAAPGLESWKRKQLLLSALTLPRVEGESVDEFARRVEVDAQTQGKEARETGTRIHGEIETAIGGGEISDFALPVLRWLRDEFPDAKWQSERSFASGLGFGGKLDCYAPGVIIDFKTSDFGPQDEKKGWDEQLLQLSAYAIGLNEDLKKVSAVNLFISTREPGIVKPVYWAEGDMQRGWRMFDCLMAYWYAKSRYEIAK
jgi:hypothetical protein